ncbi:MAG TPA: Do family serine endopeptidase [Polyangia bacterium]
MATRKSLMGGLALIALGAGGGLAASQLKISWGQAAHASPVVVAEAKPALPPPSQEQLSEARAVSRTFAQVAAQVSPSVVRISVTKTVKPEGMQGMHGMGDNPFQGTPFERFFGNRGEAQPQKERGTGSGVVIDQKGYILTNNHVVEDADEVKVSFVDGKEVKGKVVGTDPKTDLAVVKVDGVDVRPAKIGDSSKMLVGESVMAIGNPFGLDHTVTVGVLSAKNRSGFEQGHYEDFLQTDASINPGNSGGPLVNLNGEVIGINTMIFGPGGNIGIGFAVPSSMFKPIAEQLISTGKVRRPYLGIYMQSVNPELQKSLGKNAPAKGALVSQVAPDSPAQKAGLKPGDVIEKVDGSPMKDSSAVQRTVLTKKIGEKLDLSVWRDGKTLDVKTTTGEMPSDGKLAGGEESTSPHAKLGIGLQTLTPDLAERIGVDRNTKGAVITQVRSGSPAEDAGLREGDVILEVDHKPVRTAGEAGKLLSSNREGGHLLRIRRGDAAVFMVVP